MATPMWAIPRATLKRRRDAALVEIFKFALYATFPLGCMFYFGGPSFYNNHVKPYVAQYTRGMWADQPDNQIKMPADREELLEMMEEMKQKRRDRILEELASDRPYPGATAQQAPLARAAPTAQSTSSSWRTSSERLV